jgi:hypothetical protein
VDKEELEVVHDHVITDHANHEVFQRKVNVDWKDLNELMIQTLISSKRKIPFYLLFIFRLLDENNEKKANWFD